MALCREGRYVEGSQVVVQAVLLPVAPTSRASLCGAHRRGSVLTAPAVRPIPLPTSSTSDTTTGSQMPSRCFRGHPEDVSALLLRYAALERSSSIGFSLSSSQLHRGGFPM